jgi:hypothetical protein
VAVRHGAAVAKLQKIIRISIMINATENIKKALEERAHEESRPFCYGDYITVPIDEDGQAFCPKCASDDLMREVPGVGVEYDYDWVIEHIVETEGENVDIKEMYADLLDEIYEPIKFGELEYEDIPKPLGSSFYLTGVNKQPFLSSHQACQ